MQTFVSQKSGKVITSDILEEIQNLINSNGCSINKNILPTIEIKYGLDKHDVYYLARQGFISYIRTLRKSEDKERIVKEIKELLETSNVFISNRDLANRFDIGERYASDIVYKNRIKRKVERPKVKQEVTLELISRYYHENPNISYRKMATHFNCSPQTLIRRVKEGGDIDLHNEIVKNGSNQHWKGIK